MEYATLGRTGLKVSRLGFGCMRLPMSSGAEVDREKAIPMLRRAFELGVNYFDTAVMYCRGDSQRALGEAMEGIRDQVVLSTKNHHYEKADRDGWWKNLEDSLERLRTDCIDIYNFHGMNFQTFEGCVAGDDGLYKEMLKAREQGLIKHICHSFHGSCESLKQCVDTGLFESVTLQYNLLDRSLEEGIAYAAEHGMGVVVMGPVGGGRLGHPSEAVKEIVGDVQSTPELALRFVLSNPNVTLALSGMSTMQMLEENARTVSESTDLSAEDHARIEAAIQERKELAGLYCTGCGYCMPCPEGVDIPANFEILNLERVFGLTEHARARYASLGGKAAYCRLCGKCVEPCPQNLEIPERLAEAVETLDKRAGRVTGWSVLRGAAPEEPGLLKLDLRYHLKNFTDQPQEVRVGFRPHGEDQVAPHELHVEKLRPYGRREKDLEVVVRSPLQMLNLDALMEWGGARALEHVHHTATTARPAEGYHLDAAAERAGGLHVPSAQHPILGSQQDVKGHSFDFQAAYDDRALYLYVDVEEDLLCPAAEEIGRRMKADHLSIYVDGRDPEQIGRGGYTDGVMRVAVYPPADPDAEPQVRAPGDVEVSVALARTPFGYRIDCAVPWEAFSQVEGVPSVIGFDLGIDSYDAEGNEALSLTWTGHSGQDRNPGAFGRLLML